MRAIVKEEPIFYKGTLCPYIGKTDGGRHFYKISDRRFLIEESVNWEVKDRPYKYHPYIEISKEDLTAELI